jgi:hypothetical protein
MSNESIFEREAVGGIDPGQAAAPPDNTPVDLPNEVDRTEKERRLAAYLNAITREDEGIPDVMSGIDPSDQMKADIIGRKLAELGYDGASGEGMCQIFATILGAPVRLDSNVLRLRLGTVMVVTDSNNDSYTPAGTSVMVVDMGSAGFLAVGKNAHTSGQSLRFSRRRDQVRYATPAEIVRFVTGCNLKEITRRLGVILI